MLFRAFETCRDNKNEKVDYYIRSELPSTVGKGLIDHVFSNKTNENVIIHEYKINRENKKDGPVSNTLTTCMD